MITLIASAGYVGARELIYFKMMPGFAEQYAAEMVETAKAPGASAQKILETEREFKVGYEPGRRRRHHLRRSSRSSC